jgi:ABC-2 type transport system permease protein
MTTLSLPNAPAGKAHPHPLNVVRAELTKFRSLRSSYWSIAATAAVTIGLAVLVTQSAVGSFSNLSPAEQASFDGTSKSLAGLLLGQLAIGVLGVLAITSEYSTGLIRTSLAAVPHRRTFLAAKAAVVGLVALIAGTAISLAAFGIGQTILNQQHIGDSLGDPGVARAVLGGGLYVAVIAVVGLGLGAVIKHTAGTTVALVGLVFLAPTLMDALPASWDAVTDWTLPAAGQALATAGESAGVLSPGRALLVCLIWVGGSLAAGAYAITRRDA